MKWMLHGLFFFYGALYAAPVDDPYHYFNISDPQRFNERVLIMVVADCYGGYTPYSYHSPPLSYQTADLIKKNHSWLSRNIKRLTSYEEMVQEVLENFQELERIILQEVNLVKGRSMKNLPAEISELEFEEKIQSALFYEIINHTSSSSIFPFVIGLGMGIGGTLYVSHIGLDKVFKNCFEYIYEAPNPC